MALLNDYLSRLFYFVGENIAKYPKYFIIIPIILSLTLSTGVFQVDYISDVEYLFTQTNGRSHYERSELEKYFPPNMTARFDPSRPARIGRFARIIVMAQDEGTLLHPETWQEILDLNTLIHNVSIEWKGKTQNYSTICARWHEDCYENEFLDIGEIIDEIDNGTIRISYPIMFNPRTFKTHVLPQYFGGIGIKKDAFSVESVKAILLHYFIAVDNEEENQRGIKWEKQILQTLQESSSKWEKIKIYQFTCSTFSDEMEANILSIVPYFLSSVFLMGVFTMLMSMMSDWVKSKPLLGMAAVFSAGLGTLAGAGILSYLGVPLIGINLAVPFLMLGIGVDDAFVMLASWRLTSPQDAVPKRLAECYSEAAVSITITTLTDMLSFYVGILTPIPSVQFFSAYAGTCVLCIYFWQVFFFGGIMAVSGYHEAENRHSVFWWLEATPKSKSAGLSRFYRFFMVGGVDKDNPKNTEDNSENAVMTFLRDQFSTFLCNPCVKVLVVLLFIVYICISCWGVTNLQEGLKRERIVRDDSYMVDFIHKEDAYFRNYPYRIQVIVSSPLDYSQNETQQKIYNMLDDFTKLDSVTQQFGENWLRDFTRHVNNYKELYDYNITTEEDFINTLKNDFLREQMPIALDIKFNEDKTKIIATRYILQIKDIFDSTMEKDLVINLRDLAAQQTDFNVTIYHPWFHFVDQFIIIRQLAIVLVVIAAVIVMLVAILFIPNMVCSICVLFTISSIELGVLGFMSFWDVSLDLISVMCLIMCIGFSVDFSAHISYAYISAKGETSEERIREAMHSLGLPILQGGMSTIIGVSSLVFVPSYMFLIFFKIVVLVILLATWHALFVLPVLLSIFKPERGISCCKNNSYDFDSSKCNDTIDMEIKSSNVTNIVNKGKC